MKLPALLLGAVLAFGAAPVLGQGGSPMHIVIAFPAGGPVDFVARILAEGLSKELGQPVIVENKPGGNGAVSAQAVARSAPDGNTLWLTSAGAVVMNPSLYDSLTYDVQRDFTPVSLVVNNVEVLVVNAANPVNTAAELVAQSKAQKDAIPIASTGIGSMPHLALELYADSTKGNFLHVPYKGAAPAITDVMGGQVSGFFGDVPGLIAYVKGGKLKAIGIAAPARHPLLPQVPTLDEQGIRGVESNNWYALLAPAGTPAARVEQLNAAVRRALTAEPARTRLVESGTDPMPGTPADLASLIRSDGAKWSRIIRDRKIKGE